MDIVNLVNDINYLNNEFNPRERHPVVRRDRNHPLVHVLNDREFKARYRLTKPHIQRLVALVEPHLNIADNNRGLPFGAEQIVCTALEIMAGGHFFLVEGAVAGMTTTSAWRCLYR